MRCFLTLALTVTALAAANFAKAVEIFDFTGTTNYGEGTLHLGDDAARLRWARLCQLSIRDSGLLSVAECG